MLLQRKFMPAAPAFFLLTLLIAVCHSVNVRSETTNVSSQQPPNFLIILADDLGYSDLGCYGSEIATPNLDSLAQNGLRYSQFYNTARCWPTRAALLTGYYAQQVERDALPTSTHGGHGQRPIWGKLLPELLRTYGYRSYHSGKWHIDSTPMQTGFDRAYSFGDHDRYFTPRHHTQDGQPLPPVRSSEDYYATTAIADYAIECLQEHHEKHRDQPFFQYVAFTAPHFPLQALPEDIAKYAEQYQAGWDELRRARWNTIQKMGFLENASLSELEPSIGPPYDFPEDIQLLGPGEVINEAEWNSLSDEQKEFQRAKMAIHAAMIDRMDQEIGRILNHLRETNRFDNTLILFLSDNGASAEIMVRGDGHFPLAKPGSAASYLCLGPGWSSAANTPFRRHKTWVHEGGISTPLVAHWPQGIKAAGEWRQAVGHVIDIAPTLIELAGGSWLKSIEEQSVPPASGQSLTKTFSNDIPIQREALWWLHEHNRALRVGDWKLVAAKDEPWQLYNLSTDRAETENLADQFPDKVAKFVKLWQTYTDRIQLVVDQSKTVAEKKSDRHAFRQNPE